MALSVARQTSFQSRRAGRAPREGRRGGTAGSRCGCGPGLRQADAQPRQVLDPAAPGDRSHEPDADQVDEAEELVRLPVASRWTRMFEAFRSRCESDRSWSARIRRARARLIFRIWSRRARRVERGERLRTYSREGGDVLLLDRDQVRLVGEEPGQRAGPGIVRVRARKARLRGVGIPRLVRCCPACQDRQARDGRTRLSSGSSHFLRLNRL